MDGRNDHKDGSEAEWEGIEDMFIDIGMEVVDETAKHGEDEHGERSFICLKDPLSVLHLIRGSILYMHKLMPVVMDPLEEVRITIQTHMWPNMVRKPLASRTGMNLDFSDEDDVEERDLQSGDMEEGSGESEYDDKEAQATFPVDFARSSPGTGDVLAESSSAADADETALWEKEWDGIPTSSRLAAQAQFPSLEVLNQQLAETSRMFAQLKVERELAMARRMERLERLERALDDDSDEEDGGDDNEEDMGDEDEAGGEGGMRFDEEDGEDREVGPEEGEWERLDDWLDGDEGYEALEDGEEEGYAQMEDKEPGGQEDVPMPTETIHHDDQLTTPPQIPEPIRDADKIEDQGFEDDFASFQSAPTPNLRPEQHSSGGLKLNKNGIPSELPLDPTPLLMHLQSVREELAGVTDEDERRVRAAREVMAVLGLDMGDIEGMGLDGDEEEGGPLEGVSRR